MGAGARLRMFVYMCMHASIRTCGRAGVRAGVRVCVL